MIETCHVETLLGSELLRQHHYRIWFASASLPFRPISQTMQARSTAEALHLRYPRCDRPLTLASPVLPGDFLEPIPILARLLLALVIARLRSHRRQMSPAHNLPRGALSLRCSPSIKQRRSLGCHRQPPPSPATELSIPMYPAVLPSRWDAKPRPCPSPLRRLRALCPFIALASILSAICHSRRVPLT